MQRENVAIAIKRAREKCKMSQEVMATHIGLTRRHYQRLEKSGNFKMEHLEKALEKLDLQLLVLPKNDVFASFAGLVM